MEIEKSTKRISKKRRIQQKAIECPQVNASFELHVLNAWKMFHCEALFPSATFWPIIDVTNKSTWYVVSAERFNRTAFTLSAMKGAQNDKSIRRWRWNNQKRPYHWSWRAHHLPPYVTLIEQAAFYGLVNSFRKRIPCQFATYKEVFKTVALRMAGRYK